MAVSNGCSAVSGTSSTGAGSGLAVTLATSNGTGLGHITRQIAVALSLGEQADPAFLSLSRAIGSVGHFGFAGEYCPSRERGWMPQVRWQEYLRERLRAFVTETGARAIAFDGVVPYNGLLRLRGDLPDVAFVWMRRGFWRPGVSAAPLRSSALFDRVLEPGDLAAAGDRGATAPTEDAVRLPPVSLMEHLAPLSRQDAAAELGLDPDRPTALVTLSSGVLNDVAGPGSAALSALLEDPEWQVAVTRSALTVGGVPIADPARCVELHGVYPLARYLSAFDAAVSAGGYNSVHELLYSRVPTLFVPNRSSGTDDQPARTRWLAANAYALYAEESQLSEIRTQAMRLHDRAVRADLRAACAELEPPKGASAAAQELLATISPGDRVGQRPSPSRARRARVWARSAAMSTLGPRGTAVVRKVLRKTPDTGPMDPLTVRLAEHEPTPTARTGTHELSPLVLTQSLDTSLLGAGYPVEHLLPGSSEHYRQQRLRIIRRYYDVRANLAHVV